MKYKPGDLVKLNTKDNRNGTRISSYGDDIFIVKGYDKSFSIPTLVLIQNSNKDRIVWHEWRVIPYEVKTKEQQIIDKINYLYSISKCPLEKKWITKHD